MAFLPYRKITYTNHRQERDVVDYWPITGQFFWDIKHLDGLKDYVGDDGSKIQIMWENDNPTPYHNFCFSRHGDSTS